MADNEVTFVFHNTKYFWKFLNKAFDLSDMNDIFSKNANEGDYTILLAEQVPNEIYDCIDSNTGCLDTSNDSLVLLDLQDVYSNLNGVEMPYFNLNCDFIDEGNGGFTITLDSGSTSIQIQVGDSQTNYLQGMFLVKREIFLYLSIKILFLDIIICIEITTSRRFLLFSNKQTS